MSPSLLVSVATIVGYQVRECVRRRVFLAVLMLTLVFLALYALGANFIFAVVGPSAGPDDGGLDSHDFAGATIFGLAMFATLFLGAVLAVFLTLGTVRGDAEVGLLQTFVVRPIGRITFLVARFGGAALFSAAYVLVVYFTAYAITNAIGGWSPHHLVGPALGLALGVTTIAAISLLLSVLLSATAQGIVVFMVFGAGLTAGLLAQIGQAIHSSSLHQVGRIASWVLPFEGLYAAGLHALVSGTGGLTGVVLRLGPFGGSDAAGPLLVVWAIVYLVGVLAVAAAAFALRDL